MITEFMNRQQKENRRKLLTPAHREYPGHLPADRTDFIGGSTVGAYCSARREAIIRYDTHRAERNMLLLGATLTLVLTGILAWFDAYTSASLAALVSLSASVLAAIRHSKATNIKRRARL